MKHLLIFILTLSSVAMFGQRYDMSRFRPAPTVQGQVIVADSVGTALKWKPGTLSDLGGVEEAPSDTTLYVRENGDWTELTPAGLLGYDEYVALFSHDGDTIAPTPTVLYNSLGTATWVRVSEGIYKVVISGVTASNATCIVSSTQTAVSQPQVVGCSPYNGGVRIMCLDMLAGSADELDGDRPYSLLVRKYD